MSNAVLMVESDVYQWCVDAVDEVVYAVPMVKNVDHLS